MPNVAQSRDFIKKYYLDNTSTLLLPLFFGALSLAIVLQQFPAFSIKGLILENGFKAFATLSMAIYPALLGAIFGLYKLLKYRIGKKEQENKEAIKGKEHEISIILSNYEKDKGKMIPRERQYKKMEEFFDNTFKHKKYAFVVGKSGNGKSLLLSQFRSIHKANSTLFSTNNEQGENDYADEKKLKEAIEDIISKNKGAANYHYLIFDQFEKVLLRWESFKITFDSLLKELRKEPLEDTCVRFIFTCRKDKYGDVFEELQGNINEQTGTFFLSVDGEEKQDILKHIKTELQLSENDKRNNKFFEDLLEGLCSDTVSMIELNIAINYFKKMKTEIDEMFEKNTYPLKEIVEDSFKKTFLLSKPNAGMIIIYSLCCEHYAYGLTLHDFQNLALAAETTVEEILESLEEQRIIKKVHKVYKEHYPYVVAHDYLIENLKEHCKNNLSERIVLNIDFYCREKKDRELREIKEKDAKLKESPLSPYYEKAVKEESNFVTRCIIPISLCLAVFLVCILQEAIGYKSIFFSYMKFDRNYNIFAFTVFAVGIAMSYAYHYLYYFTKIFLIDNGAARSWCLLYITVGSLSAILALLANEFWVTGLAIAWLINAILHFNLSKKFPSNENIRNRLSGYGVMYLIVAVGLILLNIWVMIINKSNSSVMYPWFGVFILFVFGAIRQHLNTDWVLSQVGSFTGLCLNEEAVAETNGGVK
jgi:uncharacterized membrane protein YciS (DUF1049 family)/energy-coupling factor transporter ATP-binding protein EcfA2